MIPTIEKECSEFLQESNGHYIVKNLPVSYQGFAKVKVRLQKQTAGFSENFNKAFEDTRHKLHGSSIFGYTSTELIQLEPNVEPFFIFPINGYKFIYNPEVEDCTQDYTEMGVSGDLVSDLLHMSYTTGSLSTAIESKCEIIFYGIPYYYAIRKSIVSDYTAFIKD